MEEAKFIRTKSRKVSIAVSVMVLILLTFGIYYWQMNERCVKIDNARVSGSIVNVSAKLTGKMQEIKVKEGDQVKAGQVMENF